MRTQPMDPTGIPQQERRSRSRWGIAWSAAIAAVLGLTLLGPSTVQARAFLCRAGDVDCLIAAIRQANVQPGKSHEIRLAAGTYALTKEDNNTDGANGLPSITRTLTIRGAGTGTTIIERQASFEVLFRLMHVGPTGSLTLEQLTLQGGDVGDCFSPAGGGALFNDRGTVTIRGSALVGNSSCSDVGGGGGLFNNGGTVVIDESALIGNHASAAGVAEGGGLFNNGGTVTLVHSNVISNTAHGAGDGWGGGLFNEGGTVTILNSTIASNSVLAPFGAIGGGLLNAGGAITILNSTIADNAAEGAGGGLANFFTPAGSTLTLINSTVAGNSISLGGGGTCGGGGLFNGRGTVTILNSTIASNSDPTSGASCGNGGGGLLNLADGTVTLQNTILARNITDMVGSDCSGVVTSLGHNVLGDPMDCDIDLQEGTDLTGDPRLSEFIDDGTPGHGHFPLLYDSPAINAGNDATCPTTDQLGQPRIVICDIGAVEFQGQAVSSR